MPYFQIPAQSEIQFLNPKPPKSQPKDNVKNTNMDELNQAVKSQLNDIDSLKRQLADQEKAHQQKVESMVVAFNTEKEDWMD